MKKLLKHYLPTHESLARNRWLAPFGNTLFHPRLWHLNRHSVAGAVAVGLFCGLIPGPFQMPSAACCCMLLRVNLPLALLTTLYTNPLTIVPLYLLAFSIGAWIIGGEVGQFIAPPALADQGLLAWAHSLGDWMAHLGQPLVIGLIALAAGLAMTGYLLTRLAWRTYLVRSWRQRRLKRKKSS
ncbi:DUF2062 domain-containing protein [Zoogloea sp.]|uniref:DUF2062 domain-containing protein n=1 Tax=Zoogloea sp. TaxID=49181 RepID=UPI00260FB2DE|nr:DUF2062 domain-containing protein [Zoogloea sp.]MDD3352871.1 DUF2062 domain-containing protein [Zoogloea sp.]